MALVQEPVDPEDRDGEAGAATARPRLSQAEANALMLVWNSMQGAPPPPQRSWIDWKVVLPITLGFLSTAAVQLRTYTQLGDQVADYARRLEIVERVQVDRGKELVVQANANVLQDERLQTITKALEQERQARQDAEADMRRSDAEQRSIVADLSRVIGELRADLKVVVDRLSRRGELDRDPGRSG